MGFEKGVRALWRLLWAPLSWYAAVSPLKTAFYSPALPPHQTGMKALLFQGRLVSHLDVEALREQLAPLTFRTVFIKALWASDPELSQQCYTSEKKMFFNRNGQQKKKDHPLFDPFLWTPACNIKGEEKVNCDTSTCQMRVKKKHRLQKFKLFHTKHEQ